MIAGRLIDRRCGFGSDGEQSSHELVALSGTVQGAAYSCELRVVTDDVGGDLAVTNIEECKTGFPRSGRTDTSHRGPERRNQKGTTRQCAHSQKPSNADRSQDNLTRRSSHVRP